MHRHDLQVVQEGQKRLLARMVSVTATAAFWSSWLSARRLTQACPSARDRHLSLRCIAVNSQVVQEGQKRLLARMVSVTATAAGEFLNGLAPLHPLTLGEGKLCYCFARVRVLVAKSLPGAGTTLQLPRD